MSENLYAISIAEWIVLLRAHRARMLRGVWLANVHTGFQDFIRDWMTSHSQAKNLPTFCPQPETSGGTLSLKVLDKLEGKKKAAKQPSFQNRPFIFLFFIIL